MTSTDGISSPRTLDPKPPRKLSSDLHSTSIHQAFLEPAIFSGRSNNTADVNWTGYSNIVEECHVAPVSHDGLVITMECDIL